MNATPTVCVLMSTYNGCKYLHQQLDSIFAQEDVNVKLIVRDDGSKDNTVEILQEYKGIEIIKALNVGCEESFKELLYMPVEADYYAFADQDDVWHPRKLISAIESLTEHKCDLYVCNLMLADGEMNLQHPLFSDEDIRFYDYRMRNYILCNIHGCVQVWTKKLHQIIQTYKPQETQPHDVWVNAIANMVSKTYVDPNCYINYRLHGNNTSGLATSTFDRVKKGIKLYVLSDRHHNDILCRQLLEGYGKFMDENDIRINQLSLVANYKNSFIKKIKLLFSGIVTYNDFQHKWMYRFCILINRY